MKSEVGDPANRDYLQLSKVLFNIFTYCLHKLPLKIIHLLFLLLISLLGRSSAVLMNKKVDRIDNQPRNDENVPLHMLLQNGFIFQVDVNLASSATRVMFNDSDWTRKQICLKMWLKCHNDLYQTKDLTKQTTFLLEGLVFNRQFSENVYYGIVPILVDDPDRLECGPLIADPTFANLVPDKPYALVMKRLKEEWRLDQQLQPGKLGNTRGMEFLAHQVALMHRHLNRSLPKFGTPERIANKLDFNIEQFHKALDGRKVDPQIMAASIFSEADIEKIESVSNLLRKLSKARQGDFEKRQHERHIKRCHGDLKAANLWICPPDDRSETQERLVALDCVDFNPEFCNIDTLSDVAMLAVDLEMRLENVTKSHNEKLSGRQLAIHFLQTYLKATGENDDVWPLLEYYMSEKAMVCAYMSMLYDESPMLGERYLKVLLMHSQELPKYLPSPCG